jgi:FkbM family methyltransferase
MSFRDAAMLQAKRAIPSTVKKHIKFYRARAFERLGSHSYSRPALFELERKLEPYLSFDNGTYVECGANDGFSQSNTYYLARARGWSGLLIEAVPSLYRICTKFRPESLVLNRALSDTDGGTVRIAVDDLMGTVSSSGRTAGKTVEVSTRRLSTILDEERIPGVDFFSLDVEGFELPVLKGIDFDRHRFRYILVETSQPERVAASLPGSFRLVDKPTFHDYLFAQ